MLEAADRLVAAFGEVDITVECENEVVSTPSGV